MSIFQNTCKPEGFFGRLMLSSMNIGHRPLHSWGFSQLELKDGITAVDLGCGGGSNVKRLLKMLPRAKVLGIDYSPLAVEKTIKRNKNEINKGRCNARVMDIAELTLPDESFDFACAFETIYFWPDILNAFKNVYRILSMGGLFMICNEANGLNPKQNNWCNKINGMKMYTEEDIRRLLTEAGFSIERVANKKNGYLMVLGKK